MWTKSFIQLQVESIQERAKFANDITKILEKYQIRRYLVFLITTYELSMVILKKNLTIDQLN